MHFCMMTWKVGLWAGVFLHTPGTIEESTQPGRVARYVHGHNMSLTLYPEAVIDLEASPRSLQGVFVCPVLRHVHWRHFQFSECL